jgi:hypothetical protein
VPSSRTLPCSKSGLLQPSLPVTLEFAQLFDASYCRFGAAVDVDDPSAEPVDALTMGRMMALVAQQGGDLDVALEQVRGRQRHLSTHHHIHLPTCIISDACTQSGW